MASDMSRIICMGLLTVITIEDVKSQRVHIILLILGNAGAVLYQIVFKAENVFCLTGGIVTGILFLIISKVTDEKLGYADSIGIFALGIYLGIWKLLEVLCSTFILLALGSFICLINKRMNRRCSLPFYPFLMVGYFLWMTSGI